MTPVRFARRIFFRPRWEPVRRITREKNIVPIVSPLINLMNDHASQLLNSRGLSAISLIHSLFQALGSWGKAKTSEKKTRED